MTESGTNRPNGQTTKTKNTRTKIKAINKIAAKINGCK